MTATDTQDHAQEPQDEAQEDPLAQVRALAQQDESQALQEAMKEATVRVLQDRVVTLNVEVRLRDQRIADLETTLATYRNAQDVPAETAAPDEDGPDGS